MRVVGPVAFTLLCAIAPLCLADETITPDFDHCTLDVGTKTLKPAGPASPAFVQHSAGLLRIVVKGGTVSAFKGADKKPEWMVQSPDETRLVWLGADEKVAYFAGYTVQMSNCMRPDSPCRARRLELQSGKWLDELPLDNKPEAKQTESIQGLLTGSSQVVVLTATTDDDKGLEGVGQVVSYHVICFKAGETRPLWSKTFPSAGKVARADAVLLSTAGAPDKVQPDVCPLTRVGADILVCGGPVQDLILLKSDTGEQVWRTERVWEFERSFIGPSVWEHFIARSGGNQKGESLRSEIVGGPIVVERPKNIDRPARRSIFVAVAKGPFTYTEYLSDCVIYELGVDGRPIALTTLPRMVRGGRYHVQDDSLVWACDRGAFARLTVSRCRGKFDMVVGDSDMLCLVDWYRQVAADAPSAWLGTSPAGDPTAFSNAFAFRVIAGGYLMDADATVYNFPLAMVDLQTGADRTLLLKVPFKGKMPEPKTNYGPTYSKDGKLMRKTTGPHVLAITRLGVEGKRLAVTLGMEKGSQRLEFDLDEVEGRKPN